MKKGIFTFILFLIPLFAYAWTGLDRINGNRLYEKGNYPAASQKYGNVLHPGTPEDHYNSGDSLYKEGKYPEAEPHFLAALNSSDPKLREKALYNLGNTKYRKKNLQGAVDTYNKVLEMDPKNEKARQNRDFVLEQIKQKPPPEEKQKEDQKDQEKKDQQNQDQQKQDQKNQEEKKDQEKQDQQNQEKQDQQNQANQQEQKPGEEKAAPEEGKPMTGKEAERVLNSISDDPKGPLKEMIRQESNGKTVPAGKDW